MPKKNNLDDYSLNNSGTIPVLERHKLDLKKLCAYLEATITGFSGPLELSEFKGGQSNPTYQLKTPKKNYVLRRKPPGVLLPSAHAVDREYTVITALKKQGFPVPQTHHLCLDEKITGTIFYIMDEVNGHIYWDPFLSHLDNKTRLHLYTEKIKTLALLHSIDYKNIGLADFGKTGNYFERQISRWSKQYRASETETIPEMNHLMTFLEKNIPPDTRNTVVHGDYRLDNMVISKDNTRIEAVLDWELSTIGSPIGDFTYHLMQWYLPQLGSNSIQALSEKELLKLGIPTAKEYTALYCDFSNIKKIDQLELYLAYNFFRLAGILQGIIGRVRDGTAASKHAKRDVSQVRLLAKAGWHLLN